MDEEECFILSLTEDELEDYLDSLKYQFEFDEKMKGDDKNGKQN